MAADTNFFKELFGLDTVPRTPDEKRSIFIELVSLFDSLHDFGSLGSVYDYVTKSDDGKYITCKKTIFNHLRNGYSQLVGKPNISLKNSQLHCFSIKFHLKSSLSKTKLENAFYTYAKDHLHGRAIESNKDDLTFDQWINKIDNYDNKCFYCHNSIMNVVTMDHILSIYNGGHHTVTNVVPACRCR